MSLTSRRRIESRRAEEAASGNVLEIEDLAVAFPTGRGMLRAVDGVSLSVASGTTTGIVGESGSGKSTVLRAVMNLLPERTWIADSTRIRFEGNDIAAKNGQASRHLYGMQMSMVFQDPMTSLTPVLRVGRQIREPLQYHLRLSRSAARRRALDALREVGIPEPERRLRQYPHNLSGGMRQRVTIAIALACEPKLLLADEPTTALDVTIQHQILNLLQRAQRERNMGMVLVTHDLGIVASRTDDVIVMYAGRVVERAPTRTLFKEMRHPYTEALMLSIPRLTNPSHTTLGVIPGRPASLIDPPAGCRFAPRCQYAQARCMTEDPKLRATGSTGHEHACFFPVGTPEGHQARQSNLERGVTAAGLVVKKDAPPDGR